MELTKSEKDQINLPIFASKVVYLDGQNFEDLSEVFEAFAAEHGVNVKEVILTIDKEYGYYDEISFSTSLYVHRTPSDDEKQARLDQILAGRKRDAERRAKVRKDKAEQERKEYERLKKKFERGSIRAAE